MSSFPLRKSTRIRKKIIRSDEEEGEPSIDDERGQTTKRKRMSASTKMKTKVKKKPPSPDYSSDSALDTDDDDCGASASSMSASEVKKLRKTDSSSKTKRTAKIFVCNTCKKSFLTSALLQNHTDKWHNPNYVNGRCTLCDKPFKNAQYFLLHYRRCHQKQSDTPSGSFLKEKYIICYLCGLSVSSRNFNKHLSSHHGLEEEEPDDDSKFLCSYCPHRPSNLFKLKQHCRLVHNENFEYTPRIKMPTDCSRCSSKFDDYSKLKAHVKTVHPNNYFLCKFCDALRYSKMTMKYHYRICQRATRIEIKEAYDSFDGKDLAAHQVLCEICEKPAALRHFTQHLEQVHDIIEDVKFAKCFYCPRQFATRIWLANHCDLEHGIEIDKLPPGWANVRLKNRSDTVILQLKDNWQQRNRASSQFYMNKRALETSEDREKRLKAVSISVAKSKLKKSLIADNVPPEQIERQLAELVDKMKNDYLQRQQLETDDWTKGGLYKTREQRERKDYVNRRNSAKYRLQKRLLKKNVPTEEIERQVAHLMKTYTRVRPRAIRRSAKPTPKAKPGNSNRPKNATAQLQEGGMTFAQATLALETPEARAKRLNGIRLAIKRSKLKASLIEEGVPSEEIEKQLAEFVRTYVPVKPKSTGYKPKPSRSSHFNTDLQTVVAYARKRRVARSLPSAPEASPVVLEQCETLTDTQDDTPMSPAASNVNDPFDNDEVSYTPENSPLPSPQNEDITPVPINLLCKTVIGSVQDGNLSEDVEMDPPPDLSQVEATNVIMNSDALSMSEHSLEPISQIEESEEIEALASPQDIKPCIEDVFVPSPMCMTCDSMEEFNDEMSSPPTKSIEQNKRLVIYVKRLTDTEMTAVQLSLANEKRSEITQSIASVPDADLISGDSVCRICGVKVASKCLTRHIFQHCADDDIETMKTHLGKIRDKVVEQSIPQTFALDKIKQKSISQILASDKIKQKPLSKISSKLSSQYKCSRCSASLASRTHLKTHVETVHPDKYFPCPFCSGFRYNKETIIAHIRLICGGGAKGAAKQNAIKEIGDGPSLGSYQIPCGLCGTLIGLHGFNPHLKQVHGVAEHPMKCYHCDKAFSNRLYFADHSDFVHGIEVRNLPEDWIKLNLKDETPPTTKTQCPLIQLQKTGPKTDKSTYRSAMAKLKVVCEICGKSMQKIRLKTHIYMQHGDGLNADNWFMCSECPKRFKYAQTLKYHVQEYHRGEKHKVINCPMPCELCGKEVTLHSFERHFKKVHGVVEDKTLKCFYCPNEYVMRYGLAFHVSTVHGVEVDKFPEGWCNLSLMDRSDEVIQGLKEKWKRMLVTEMDEGTRSRHYIKGRKRPINFVKKVKDGEKKRGMMLKKEMIAKINTPILNPKVEMKYDYHDMI